MHEGGTGKPSDRKIVVVFLDPRLFGAARGLFLGLGNGFGRSARQKLGNRLHLGLQKRKGQRLPRSSCLHRAAHPARHPLNGRVFSVFVMVHLQSP